KLPKGFFVAVWNLVDSQTMNENEIEEYWKQRAWIEEALPIPPFYEDGNSISAITWFKNNAIANEISSKLNFYYNTLKKYNRPLFKTTTNIIPGKIVYEDEYQIAVTGSLHEGPGFITEEFT